MKSNENKLRSNGWTMKCSSSSCSGWEKEIAGANVSLALDKESNMLSDFVADCGTDEDDVYQDLAVADELKKLEA